MLDPVQPLEYETGLFLMSTGSAFQSIGALAANDLSP